MRSLPLSLVILVALAAPLVAQPRVGSVRQSPFIPGTSRLYDADGKFVGTARQNPFLEDRIDLYDSTGRATGFLRENPFDPTRIDVFDNNGDRDGP